MPGSRFARPFLRSPAGTPAAILIDGRRELIAISPDGLIGDQLIHDTHHPTLPGYVALAAAVLRQLDRRKVFCHSQLACERRSMRPNVRRTLA